MRFHFFGEKGGEGKKGDVPLARGLGSGIPSILHPSNSPEKEGGGPKKSITPRTRKKTFRRLEKKGGPPTPKSRGGERKRRKERSKLNSPGAFPEGKRGMK